MPKKHGYRHTATYQTWIDMRRRCYDETRPDYARYGGRGIRVCAAWQSSFETFLRDMGERPEGKTLDRIDVDGAYCKENCRWATQREQLRNTRFNRKLTYRGKTQTLIEWADELGIVAGTIAARLRRGWSTAKTLSTALNATRAGQPHNQRLITYRGRTMNVKEWAAHFGIKHATLSKRLTTYGMSFEQAISKPT